MNFSFQNSHQLVQDCNLITAQKGSDSSLGNRGNSRNHGHGNPDMDCPARSLRSVEPKEVKIVDRMKEVDEKHDRFPKGG